MRLPFNRIIRKVTKYRLGYNVQRDYPGHWTTPVVLFVYMALATFLALMNIPLTAYDTVQEYTYTPNATILPLPFSYLVPTFLRSRLPDFSPRTLRVGDILYLNESIEEYNVTSADVDSFLFYNNPLTSCDVQDMTMQIYTNTIGIPPMRISARISCWFPVRLKLQWESIYHPSFAFDLEHVLSFSDRCSNASIVMSCIGNREEPAQGSIVEWTIGGEANCPGSSPPSAPDLTDHLPCNSDPVNFVASLERVKIVEADGRQHYIFVSDKDQDCVYFQDPICASTYALAKENAFQGVYHYIRRDLGIRSPNQIWGSPVVFNKTIHALPPNISSMPSTANELRANRTGSTWVPWDMEHDTSIKTPKIYYSRWTYRRKSLGSAITSVFVATFTMLAAIWKGFSFIAGLVISKADDEVGPPNELEPDTVRELREEQTELATQVRRLENEMQRMLRGHQEPEYRLSLADMGASPVTESLLSAVNRDSKDSEEDWNGSQDAYDRV